MKTLGIIHKSKRLVVAQRAAIHRIAVVPGEKFTCCLVERRRNRTTCKAIRCGRNQARFEVGVHIYPRATEKTVADLSGYEIGFYLDGKPIGVRKTDKFGSTVFEHTFSCKGRRTWFSTTLLVRLAGHGCQSELRIAVEEAENKRFWVF